MAQPVEVFPPGDFIREELEERGWTQGDLASIMGRPVETINRIVTGKLTITPETARGVAAAFGTSAELWLNLEAAYQLSRVRQEDNIVARRARLFSIAPVKNMVKRGWIEPSNSIDVMEQQFIRFFKLSNVDEEPRIAAAARKATTYTETTPILRAWYFRVKQLAAVLDAKPYSKKKLEAAFGALRALAIHPQEARHVPHVLADAGVRFVVTEHLPKTKIDGATLWLDEKRPVIAISLRYDRIDWFWHTLAHELSHVLRRDALSLDEDMTSDTYGAIAAKPEHERLADEFASSFLVARDELDDFIRRVRPLYSKKKIQGFAQRIGVHPGIVVGLLQYRQEISYSHSREMLAKVRDVIVPVALTDGWGNRIAGKQGGVMDAKLSCQDVRLSP